MSRSTVTEFWEGWADTVPTGVHAVMRDGGLELRPVRAEDADRVQSFVRALSPESRRSRFFGALSELSPYMLRRLTQPAYPSEFGMIALAGADATSEIVGMAQYAPDAPWRAELSVAVADAWQRRGLATRFIRALVEHASLAGVRALCAVTLADNGAALGLMQRLKWTLLKSPEPGLVRFEKSLAPPAPRTCIALAG